MQEVLSRGGEGVVLRKANASYFEEGSFLALKGFTENIGKVESISEGGQMRLLL
jgi:hypothetical protein